MKQMPKIFQKSVLHSTESMMTIGQTAKSV